MIKIIADSTCDLSEEIVKKYNIDVVSLTITFNGKDYKDRVDLTPDDFYGILESLESEPTTGMPSPNDFLDAYKKAVVDGYDEIICICMSSGTSGSYQSAALAKNFFYEDAGHESIKLKVIDSKSMSHGSGWLILKTARLIEDGVPFDELVDFNETYKKNVKHFLCVDDLDHLIKSGRLTNVSAFFGKMLRVKPIMSMKDGKGAIVAKIKGKKRVLRHYVNEFMKRIDRRVTDFIIIGYTSDIKIAKNLENKIINETDYKGEIFIMQMGVAVGTHVGLGAISMFFVEKNHEKDNLFINERQKMIDKKNEMMNKFKEFQMKNK